MGIGLVQCRPGARPGIGHAQHPAQQLLNRRGRADGLHAAQHIGKRAVPAFTQGLRGDDVAHRAGAAGQVQLGQATFSAGGHHHLLERDVQVVQQMRAQHVHGHRLAAVLRLQQHDGADVVALVWAGVGFFLLGLGLQQALLLHRVEHGRLPAARVFHQRNRHLDHVLGLQLLGRHMEQHIAAPGNGRGRQLQDQRRVQALERLEAALGLGVVGLIDDHIGLAQRQPVGQAETRLAHKARQQAAAGPGLRHIVGRDQCIGQATQRRQRRRWLAAEMRLEGLGKGIDLALLGVVHPEALDGGHHHHGLGLEILRRQRGHAVQIAHPHIGAASLHQRRVERMARGGQGRQGLGADGITGHQPQRQRLRRVARPAPRQAADGMRGQQRLATAGGVRRHTQGTAPKGSAW